MTETHREPKAFRIAPEKSDEPAKARRRPRGVAASKIEFEPVDNLGEIVVVPPRPLPSSRRWRWGAILVSSLAGLAAMWAGLAISQLIEDFFTRSPILGWTAAAVAGLAGLAALAIIFREIYALWRLRRIEHIQADAAHAINHGDVAAAERAIDALAGLYQGRADTALGLKELAQQKTEIMDAADRLRLADRDLVSPLDDEVHRIIARAARRITLLTAVTPAAALDIIFVAAQNLRMLREIATLYGGRPSTLATIRLARMVIGHLAVTGGLALSDNLLQHVVGKGILGRLSARFGEGAVNGILTSRIGLAARDVCRPLPQEPQAKETLASILAELVSLKGNDGDDKSQSQS
jgi:putative membrane protein